MALVSFDCTLDKGLSNIWSMIHLVSSSSLKYPAAVLRGASLLRQTGLFNGHAMGLCLVHIALSPITLASKVQKPNKRK
ncbi:hypothetical protein TNIN_26521 [Trichonephila inaurata madagascariensis]|uniref:Uncharacterized protein n=1 Tax=Trichonephila inaurata madagascariensis TaxID=2747483 RepID=A0A8X7CFL7_9ARAC|nr:hypothetical protein TNIN_26521 [Trichonephila inaurata madagascariensis]